MKNSVLNKMISGTLMAAMLMISFAPCASAKGLGRFKHHEDLIALGGVDETIMLKGDVSLTDKDEKVSLSLKDSDVEQVLRMFADIAGLNIVFYDTVSNKITLDIVDMPVNEAFTMVMEMSELTYNIMNGNTLVIAKAGSDISLLKKGITFIPLKYIEASVIADFLNKNVFGAKKPGLSGSDIVSINPVTNELMLTGTENDVAVAKKVIEKFDKKPAYTTFKVNFTTPKEMATMICETLLPTTGSKSSSAIDETKLAKSGKYTGAASSLELGANEIACTVKPTSNAGGLTSLDLQGFSISYQDQNGLINMIGGSDDQIAMVKDFIKFYDRKIPQAYLEVSIIELTENGSKDLTNTWAFHSKMFNFTTSGGTLTNDVPIWIFGHKGGSGYTYSETVHGSGDDAVTVSVPAIAAYAKPHSSPSWSLQYNINYALSNTKARTVANPRILVTNGEESTIDITSTYIESTTIQSMGTVSTYSTRSYNIADDAGVQISVTPFISPDGYVTMEIKPSYTVVGEPIMETDPYTGLQYTAATMTSSREFELKNVRVKDGETLVIGGMIMESDNKAVSKIPFLGDLPIIGSAFRSTTSQRSKSEMLVMITPKIIYDDEDL